ncbi:GntR family transcriptional regulator [Phycicoccus elongatus]|uniref:Putative GntR family transcriptional regulator n=1 Tax=Phycicoccus elongatus Lp2 TaxID=1193181 RepID=N0E2R9_9MICO|nr:GntR family transcriptional regulator [Phycicoccus elongatus]CCH69184.1 putative GntR family transcriptional regulator [Phycicoccus elongatus Lp2]HOA65465.1 GntR family transcriptional regulator [Phycicoccus elongatus]
MTPSPDGRPIFLEIADQIAADILVGAYPEQAQVPSTNELSVHYRVNPATAGKALNRLVDDGVLYKRRGLGMFVAEGAPEALRARRRAAFADEYVRPFLAEGRRLGLSLDEITDLIHKEDR